MGLRAYLVIACFFSSGAIVAVLGQTCSSCTATPLFPQTFQNVPRDLDLRSDPSRTTIVQFDALLLERTNRRTRDNNVKALTLLDLGNDEVGVTARIRDSSWVTNDNSGPTPIFPLDHLALQSTFDVSPDQACCVNDSRVLFMTATLAVTEAVFRSPTAGWLTENQGLLVWDSSPQAVNSWRLSPETNFTSTQTGAVAVFSDADDDTSEETPASRRRRSETETTLLSFNGNRIVTFDSSQSVCGVSLFNQGTGAGGSGSTGSSLPLETSVTVLIHTFSVSVSEQEETQAVVIQNAATEDFLTVPIDGQFNIPYDPHYSEGSSRGFNVRIEGEFFVPVLPLDTLPASVFNATKYFLGDLSYFQNSDIERILSPDQRFFTKRYLSEEEDEFILCSLHHQDSCAFILNGQLVLVPVGLVLRGFEAGRPTFQDLSDAELRFAVDLFAEAGGAELALFRVESDLSTILPSPAACHQRGNYYSPVPGTNCKKFTQSTRFISEQHDCGPGTAFDPAVCVCNHKRAFTCPCP